MIKNELERDQLSIYDRLGEFLSVFGLLYLLGFFVVHHIDDTGFFTQKFGSTEQFFLYMPMAMAFFPPLIRTFTGHRQPARLFDATTEALQWIGAIWLLMIFPFDYAHLADVLPTSLQFILAWVTDDLAKFVLLLQIVISPIAATTNMWRYVTFPKLSNEYHHV